MVLGYHFLECPVACSHAAAWWKDRWGGERVDMHYYDRSLLLSTVLLSMVSVISG